MMPHMVVDSCIALPTHAKASNALSKARLAVKAQCHRLFVPCFLLRMLLIAPLAGGVAKYCGWSTWGSIGLAVAAIITLQIVVFLFVLVEVAAERRRRQQDRSS
jgi:hypothetical protein